MPHFGGAPKAAQAPARSPILQAHQQPQKQQPDVPLVSDPADADGRQARVVIDTVNDNVSRVSGILARRAQAQELADDITEQKAARAAEFDRAADAAAQEMAARQKPDKKQDEPEAPSALERIASAVRAAKDPKAEVTEAEQPTAIAGPTAGNGAAVSANQGLSAAAPLGINEVDYGDAVPAASKRAGLRAQGAMQQPRPAIELEGAGGDAPFPGSAVSPSVTRQSSVDPMLAIQQQYQTRVEDDPRDIQAQMELQLLRFLKDEPVPAMGDLSALPTEDRELLAAVCDALSNFRSVVKPGASPLGSEKARPFIEMADRIRARSDLNVSSVELCSAVRAFGNYDPIPLTFPAGQANWTVFYCEVDGFLGQLNEKQQWDTKLSLELRLYSEAGLDIWSTKPETVTDSSRKRRRDFFIAKKVQLPSTLAPGRYLLKASVRDLQANRVAESTLQLDIVAK